LYRSQEHLAQQVLQDKEPLVLEEPQEQQDQLVLKGLQDHKDFLEFRAQSDQLDQQGLLAQPLA
jgi:hypothetical protein